MQKSVPLGISVSRLGSFLIEYAFPLTIFGRVENSFDVLVGLQLKQFLRL
ncbi:MAG: hypothetical protein ACK4R6_11635 [Spirosomataceae bacterium]